VEEAPDLSGVAENAKLGKRRGNILVCCPFSRSILKLCRAGLIAKPYTFKREDGQRELGRHLTAASDGQPC